MHTQFNNFYKIEKWRIQIYYISYDIKNDQWTINKFIIIIDINDFAITKYIIYYRDVFQIMCFLLDHKSFQKNLNYALMRIKTSNDSCVYNEMHIKN